MIRELEPIPLEEIRAARERIAGVGTDSPLVRLNVEHAPAEIYLKLENLQPIGSFKLRGAGNIMKLADRMQLEKGVWTASAGNMAQGVAWHAREMGLECTIVVPDHAPETKLEAIRRLGGKIVKVPVADWFQILRDHGYRGMEGFFIHPVSNRHVIAGHGTIGLEILEQLPDVEAVIAPYGGGALSTGIASALRALIPNVKVYAAEVETAAPLAPSLAAGMPVEVEYTSTFVDGMGAPFLIEEMWPLVRQLLDGSLIVSVKEIADAIRLLVERNRVVAEGAGAAPVAAALTGQAGEGKVVCIVSGGNIDTSKLVKILQGRVP
ncbi:MAG TPA: pyridoxal-phosphate dependent enzyme [Anaerolineae bacterium]|nr:pyridoxal-phosphate dependent enzyme [Anaerolineae bacterium]